MVRLATLATLLPAIALLPAGARANCAAPVTYSATVSGHTVTVCPENFHSRMCPDEGLLRQAASATDGVVITTCDAQSCFVDECVPAGSYRYGLVKPYACQSSSCGTYYFVTADVVGADGNCTRTPGLAAPAAFTGSIPWGSSAQICGYGRVCGVTGGATAGTVLSINALALVLGVVLSLRRKRA